MRYAIVSDLHANRQAWDSVLADITSCGVDTIICLGDVVGYGPMPQEVLDQVREWCAAVVIGNHDAAACGRMDASIFNDEARAVVEWTRGRINAEGHRFLTGLPAAVDDDEVLFVHAEVISPERFDYITDQQIAAEHLAACHHRMVFFGHTHQQAVFVERGGVVHECAATDFDLVDGCRYLVNVGSVGEPRDPDDLRARYVIFDSDSGKVTFRAVDFDFKGYREDLDREGLPVVPYFLQAREANAAAKRMLVVPPTERAMRLMPISQAAEHRDQRSVAPSRLVVVPLPAGASGQRIASAPSIKLRDGAVDRGGAGRKPSPAKRSHKGAILVWLLVMVIGGGLVAWYFKTPPSDEALDLQSELAAESGERLIENEAAENGAEVNAQKPMRPLAARLLTYLAFDDSLQPAVGSVVPPPARRGSARLVPGRMGKGLAMNGNLMLGYGEPGDYAIGDEGLTVGFWFAVQSRDAVERVVIGNLPAGDAVGVGWQVAVSSKSAAVEFADGTKRVNAQSLLKQKPRKGGWHHVAAVIDPLQGKMRIHLDGEEPVEIPVGKLDLVEGDQQGITIGGVKGGDGKLKFRGRIDDLAIWQRALEAREIESIRSAANGDKQSIGKLLSGGKDRQPSKE